MSRYIKLSTNEYPRHQGDIRLEYPDMGNQFVLPETYAYVEWVDAPSYNEATQIAQETSPEFINDKWYMRWIVQDLTQEEIDFILNHTTGVNNANNN